MEATPLDENTIQEILHFYAENTTRATLKKFHIRLSKLNALLAEYNQPQHAKIKTELSTEDIQNIIEQYPNYSDTTLCKQYHITKTRLHEILNKYNVTLHTNTEARKIAATPILTEETIKKIILFYAENNLIATAREFHTSKDRVLALLEKNNIKLHSEAKANAIKRKKQSEKLSSYYTTHVSNSKGKANSRRKQLTEQEKIELIEFHKTHSDNATRIQFKLTNLRYNQIINGLNLTKHPREFNVNIRSELQKTKIDDEQAVINFYKINSVEATMKQFHIGNARVYQILADSNIPLHTTQEKLSIGQKTQKQTLQERYGVEQIQEIPGVAEARKATCLERYGVGSVAQVKEIQEKRKQTCRQKYGCDFAITAPEVQEKIHVTMLERYGKEGYQRTDRYKEKAKATRIAHFGQNRIPQARFQFNNLKFDSFPELCFYLYHYTTGHNIKRESATFTFKFQESEHQYIPDFEIDGKFYEIKGKHFLTEENKWCCVFDHSLDDFYEAKHQCALENNVNIIYTDEYKFYENWFIENGYHKEDFVCSKTKG